MVKRGNEYYTWEASLEKNRAYLTCMGSVPSVDAIPNFESDCKKTANELKTGWSVLGNFLNQEGKLPPDVEKIHSKAQQYCMTHGCIAAAQVAPIEVIVQINKFSKESGMKEVLKGFHTVNAAESWLDTK
ncbi:hypothetical protein NEF87_004911 [Candidatus Lokiarchaeum ossiferum]|uniref:Uncharacterized protein n=1 Tax=Candidatus Lokiarchaeum ossiferum TaxID=2951803 RepID=A0ABY6HYM0_9ARCH|nr:hypothetical protein NEF87_004911 [Candidatus Lokiarchaeum sp. B-35]